MKKYKSINEVLKRGQIEVNGPVAIIISIVPLMFYFLSSKIFPKEYVAFGILGGFILGFVLAWSWWSYRIVKWRIWAFENTKPSDWKSLRARAVAQNLTWNEGHIFEKTELRSIKETMRIIKINSKIDQIKDDFSLDNIDDDPKIPSKIEYSYKRSETILSALLPIIFVIIGLYLITINTIIIGILAIGLAFYLTSANKIKDIWKKEIQLSIGNNGIDLKKFEQIGFVKWNDTQDITVDTENGILQLEIWEQDDLYKVIFELNDYDIGDYDDFLRIINVYLKRNLKQENNSE